MKRFVLLMSVGLLLFSGLFILQAAAETYPSKDIRWVLGGKPGGGFDTYARAIGRYMEKYMPEGVHVIVENKPGAGHRIAMATVYNAAPDGYMIGMPMMAGLYIDQMYEKQKYDMTKVTWLGMILHEPRVLCVAPDSRYKTLETLQQADSPRVAINGFASESDVILVNGKIGIEAQYIPGHKNPNEAVLALMRGDADAVAFTFGSLREFIVNKQLIPLAVYGSDERLSELPDTPTLKELGHPDLNEIVGNFRVIAGPPDMPEERSAYLRDTLWKVFNDEEFIAWSKKAKREVAPKDGRTTQKIMTKLMQEYNALKDDLKPYYTK